jgi:hypothetical protein
MVTALFGCREASDSALDVIARGCFRLFRSVLGGACPNAHKTGLWKEADGQQQEDSKELSHGRSHHS